jgi:hypothetical protein
MRWFLVCWVGWVACTDVPPPPFAFEIQKLPESGQPFPILRLEFENYESAIGTAHTVSITNNDGTSFEVATEIGLCREFSCTGPVTLEQLVLSAEAPTPFQIGYTCRGLDGLIAEALDFTLEGDCAR